ncbi:amidohydrolase family protein [bacterium]|nr:amidohydrolase family protein [candidate division CSSED10-310 bacterium]
MHGIRIHDGLMELRYARIVDVVAGRYLPIGTTVRIEDGRIKDLVAPGEHKPEPAEVIDLTGLTLIPGLINTHCHATWVAPPVADLRAVPAGYAHYEDQLEKNMYECLRHGITTIRDAWCNDLRRRRRLVERIRRGDIIGPDILGSVVVTQPDAYMAHPRSLRFRLVRTMAGLPLVDHRSPQGGEVVFPADADARTVRAAVDLAIDERGADSIKLAEQRMNLATFKLDLTFMTVPQMQALTDQARRRGVSTTMHHCTLESFRRAVRGGVHSLSHVPLDGELTDRDLEDTLSAGCSVEPTMSVAYAAAFPVRGDRWRDHPGMTALTAFRDATWERITGEFWLPLLRVHVRRYHARLSRGMVRLHGLVDLSGMVMATTPMVSYGARNLTRLYDAGVPLACSNDGGVPPTTPGMLGIELGLLDLFLNTPERGVTFTGLDGLRMATSIAARTLGMEHEIGRIEPGLLADLAVVNGDPLNDVHVLGAPVEMVFTRGRLISFT